MYGLCHEWFVYQSMDLPSRTQEGEGRNVYVLCVYVYVLLAVNPFHLASQWVWQ